MGLQIGRKPGESIVLPSVGVELTLLEIRKGRARLQVDAPQAVPVVRRELLDPAIRVAPESRPAAYRVLWADLDRCRVGTTTAGPYWTCLAAALRIRERWWYVVTEVVIDSAACRASFECCETLDLLAAAAGSFARAEPQGYQAPLAAQAAGGAANVYEAWLQLATRLGAVGTART